MHGLRLTLVTPWLVLLGRVARAADTLPLDVSATGASGMGEGMGQLAIRVVLVLLLLGAVLWLLKRFRLASGVLPVGPSPLGVVAARGLGPRRQVVLVRVGRKVLVLGVSEAGIHTLDRFEGDEAQELIEPAAGKASGFATVLSTFRNDPQDGTR